MTHPIRKKRTYSPAALAKMAARTQAKAQVIIDAIARGRTLTEIAAERGVTGPAISSLLKRVGVSGREYRKAYIAQEKSYANTSKRIAFLRAKIQRTSPIIHARDQGLTYQKIADLFGLIPMTAHYFVKNGRAAQVELDELLACRSSRDYEAQLMHLISMCEAA